MLDKKLVTAVSALVLLGILIPLCAMGQSSTQQSRVVPLPAENKSLADRIDDFGSKIFGGFLPKKDSRPQPTVRTVPQTTTPRAGSISRAGSTTLRRQKSTVQDMLGLTPPKKYFPSVKSGRSPDAVQSPNTPVRIPVSRTFEPSSAGQSVRSGREQNSPVVVTRSLPKDLQRPSEQTKTTASPSPSSETRVAKTVSGRPLHERFSIFAESAFETDKPKEPSADSSAAVDPPAQQPARQPTQQPSQQPTQASRPLQQPASERLVTPPQNNTVAEAPYHRPLLSRNESTGGTSASSHDTKTISAQAGSNSKSGAVSGTPRPGRKADVLFARKSPSLSVQTLGPRQIAVGKESAYELTIDNSGQSAADDVVLFINLPPWANVLGAEASTGATGPSETRQPGEATVPFLWRIGRMEAGSRERLVLRIVPRESRPFDLAVRWEYKPPASQTMIEVQEAKLVASLDGPSEVLYGKQEVFRLKLANTGNGDAENVQIMLTPVGTAGNRPVSHNMGTLRAGKEKVIEVELTARQEGQLLINVQIQGDGGVRAELAEKVLVRRPALQIELEGPHSQYVGAVAAYRVHVRNPGTAPAKNVRLSVTLPPGTKYVSGIDGANVTGNGTEVSWTLDSLNASGEQVFAMQCRLGLAGASRIEAAGSGDGELVASATTMTRVQAIADLVLNVKDPTGPIPVGKEVRYEFRVRNRGTTSAHDVEVVGYFSRGIEPTKAEGAQARLGPGQVVFGTIPSIAAGAELPLTVFARAETEGNHICRVEVQCKSLGTRLVCEEMTHYYDNGTGAQNALNVDRSDTRPLGATTVDAPSSMSKREVLRTAQRPEPPTTVPSPNEPTPATRPSGTTRQ